MANLNVTNFNKLKVFLKALQDINFDPAKPIPSFTKINGIPTPVDKTNCFKILQSFPDFKGKENSEIIKDLQNPLKANRVFGDELTKAQQIELAQTLAEKPVAAGEPLSGQVVQAEQPVATGPTATGSSGGLPFGMPSGPSVSPVIHTAPRVEPPTPPTGGKEVKGGEGTGSAVRRKIQLNEAANAPKVPNTQLRNPLQEQGPATTKINRLQASAANPGLKFQTGPGNTLKNLGSSAGRFTKRNLGRIANGLTNSVLPAGANFLGSASLGAINHGGNFLSNLSNTRSRMASNIKGAGSNLSSSLKGGRKVAVASVLAFLLIFGIAINGAMTGTTPPGQAAPTTPTTTSDISSCKFTRGQENPKEASFKSNLLLSYIQEAAQKSSIPPAVLAAFIRVESPSVSNKSDEEITNYAANCAQSPTGALGIMQIQPPGTTSAAGDPASCDDCIDAGAKLVGKTVSSMTKADYCDPRTSIIVGAGWILKKMTYWGYGDGTKWNPAWTNDKKAITTLVHTYYGDVLYPDVNIGPFNYADDVSTSIQNCQTTPIQNTPPDPASPVILDRVKDWAKVISGYLNPYDTSILTSPVINGSYSTGDYAGGGYACTYLVIDSYNLAGIPGLSKNYHGWVGAMENFWRNTSGYIFLDYQQNRSILKNVQSGFAMFQQEKPGVFTGNEHVSIVEESKIDSHGDGYIATLDSNTGHYRGWRYTVDNWNIINNFTDKIVPGGEIITGFGGH